MASGNDSTDSDVDDNVSEISTNLVDELTNMPSVALSRTPSVRRSIRRRSSTRSSKRHGKRTKKRVGNNSDWGKIIINDILINLGERNAWRER